MAIEALDLREATDVATPATERTWHWGVLGVRERTVHLGGELEVWSEPRVSWGPAFIAYEAALSQDSSWQF